MDKKQLALLFAYTLIIWTAAQGTLALLPVYAVRLGADPASVGNFLSLAFGALTAGTITAGWLSDKFQRRRVILIIAGLVCIPATWLMGHVTGVWQLAALTAIVWFCFGASLTIVNILVGIFASATERGKIFGIIALNTSLGALIGGAISGQVVDQGGFAAWFLLVAVGYGFQPFIALLIQDKSLDRSPAVAPSGAAVQPALGAAFYLLMLANVIAFATGFMAALGRPLLMDSLGFDSTAISGVVAVGGAVSLPLPVLLGWLSDRVGRYWLIALSFFLGFLGVLTLAGSFTLWHFWVSSILLACVGSSLALGPALVTDMVPQEKLGKALAWYGFSPSVGGILGFALTGYAIQGFGMGATFMGGAVLTIGAVLLIIQVRRLQLGRLASLQAS